MSSPPAASSAASAGGAPKTKASIVSGPKSPCSQSHNDGTHSPKPNIHPLMATLSDVNSFEAFALANPSKADELMGKLVEVTGVTGDRGTLCKAFDQSRKSDPNHEFNVAHAIEWILQLSESSSAAASVPSNNEERGSNRKTPAVHQTKQFAIPTATTIAANSNLVNSAPLPPPPNSPTAASAGGGDVLKSNSNAAAKPLVDLTESGNGSGKDVDPDLEKAIQLSLQEVKRSGGGAGEGFGVTQEEQDVSRALEASLMDNQFGGKTSRGIIDYVDPLNPHDRERNGMVCYVPNYITIKLMCVF